METFLKAGERGLKARAEDEQAAHERELQELRAKVGALVLEQRPFGARVCGVPLVSVHLRRLISPDTRSA